MGRLTFLLALGAILPASDAEAPKRKYDVDSTMTVTAEAEPVELVKTPSPITVFDQEAIERSGANTVEELLSAAFPGQIITNGGVGTSTSISLGGARTQDVVVTLDGIRLTDPSGLGSVNLSGLGLAGIDRVEVETGPCSSRFGAEAMGGVIALYSSGSAPKGLSGSVAQQVGTQGILGLQIGTALGWESGWVRFSADGYREEQATPTPDPFRSVGTSLGLGQQLGTNTLLTMSYRNAYTGVPLPYKTVTPTTRIYDENRESATRNQQLVGSLRTSFSPDWTGELSLGHVVMDRKEPGLSSGFSVYESRRSQAVGRLGWNAEERHRLTLSVDAYEETAFTPAYPVGREEGRGSHLAADVEGVFEPVDALRVLAVVRHQWDKQRHESTGSGNATPPSRLNQATWKLGVNALLTGGFRIYASGGKAFGLPLLSAVMHNASNGATTPLQKERSRFELLGASWEQGPWSLKLEAHRTNFKRLVYFDLNVWQYANGSDIRTQSAQLTVAHTRETWGIQGFYRNQEARDLKATKDQRFSTPAVLRRPFQSFGLKSHLIATPFRIDLDWSWFGPRYENYGGWPTTIGASKVHFNDLSLAAAWLPRKDFSLTLRGQHLLQPKLSVTDWENRITDGENDAYQIFGFPAQPPTWTLEARYRF